LPEAVKGKICSRAIRHLILSKSYKKFIVS
jgi:hypothetical protein